MLEMEAEDFFTSTVFQFEDEQKKCFWGHRNVKWADIYKKVP
jgi:hypothetical protein